MTTFSKLLSDLVKNGLSVRLVPTQDGSAKVESSNYKKEWTLHYDTRSFDTESAGTEPWFMLFEHDTRPPPRNVCGRYVGRTTDKELARTHYQKCCDEYPFGDGGVQIVTDTEISWANSGTQWDKL